MIAGRHVFSKTSLALLAAIALSGCMHHHGAMMDHHMHYMAKQSARLGELVDIMNSTEGAAKLDAIAAVVNELVDQHRHPYGFDHGEHAAGGCDCPLCPHASDSCFMD